MGTYTIYNLDGDVIFSHACENNSLELTIEAAVKQGADLLWADFLWADLPGAD